MAVDRDGRRGDQDEISFVCLFVCKRIEGEGDQEQYENKGSLAGGGGSCIASCIV